MKVKLHKVIGFFLDQKEPVILDVSNIESVTKKGNGSIVTMSNEKQWHVHESVDVIEKMINPDVPAGAIIPPPEKPAEPPKV